MGEPVRPGQENRYLREGPQLADSGLETDLAFPQHDFREHATALGCVWGRAGNLPRQGRSERRAYAPLDR